MTGRQADSISRDVIARAGYGEAFLHSLGHGIGLEVHEPPWLSQSRGDEPLRPGMVFSIEPGIYIPGWGGVRIEDLVVLENGGPRVLCSSPKELVRNSPVATTELEPSFQTSLPTYDISRPFLPEASNA
jgi:Xaa-Pro aminopeptidase